MERALAAAANGELPAEDDALALAGMEDLGRLLALAGDLTLAGHGRGVTFSRNVFIPLTMLCRDVCHYCTFAKPPSRSGAAYLSLERILEIAERGAAAGAREALFTLGDRPEARYATARRALDALGHGSTLSYLEETAGLVLERTGLLPHLNPGLMDDAWIARLRRVSVSMGLMLESSSERLCEKGGPHHGSPDKRPERRLATIDAAGRASVPFTSGLLVGIGETRRERIESLLALRRLQVEHGHIQELIIQNFRAKPGTRMAGAPEPSLEDQLWTIAVARIVLGPRMHLQAPPNLRPDELARLIAAGIDDWGGVSAVTPDHVNPEAPWPEVERLARETEAAGRELVERLAVHAEHARDPERWLDPATRPALLRQCDGMGLAREDAWTAGALADLPKLATSALGVSKPIAATLARLEAGECATENEIEGLFEARGADLAAILSAADARRAARSGDVVTYVVNRNINYTNICTYGCKFCAFSKGAHTLGHRDKPYDLPLAEIVERSRQAVQRGATEVCLQGGIRPGYTGHTYRAIVEAIHEALPELHVHAFSPLEVWHGASTLAMPLADYLSMLRSAGLSSLPGTAAEILDDEVRAILCPDKIDTAQWLEVMRAAHGVGLASTATIMFGHVDGYRHWARHLLRVRTLQAETGGFTEFVPLPFVHMEAPIYLKGRSRKGPTWREALLMHAVARLVLDPLITNIQASWVKMGPNGAAVCLTAGANDLGGVLMNESITRAAGAAHGQELDAAELERLIRRAGRIPRQRTTLYGVPPDTRTKAHEGQPNEGRAVSPALAAGGR
ncbi:MAG: 7,8-didemethyl-8-hydroxy-5-deazariboflavin synthase subunit CofH [Rhizobiales bacterium]|nr:7,8-didemethyl-8-hydroxy-5-deazariboflavin synthase subunit CofH [Hyphomicrobiales bacterium]